MVENEEDAKDLPEVVEKVKKPVEKVKKMSLTKEERVGIILLCGSRSLRQTAEDFNKANPDREKITHSCVSKVLAKFRETGSILDKPHVAKKRVTDETTSTYILAKFSMNPSSSIRRMALETNVSKTSIRRILRANHVVTLSTIGAANHHHHNNSGNGSSTTNPGEFHTGNGFPGTMAKKKAPSKPRKSKAAIAAAAAAAATAASTVTTPITTSTTINPTINNHHQVANKWQQHQQQQQQMQQQQQQQPSSSTGHSYGSMPDFKDMPTNDYMQPVPAVLKSPKPHKMVAATNNWNAPSVGYGYGGQLLYPSAMGFIDPIPPQ